MKYQTTSLPGPGDARDGIVLPASPFLRRILSVCVTLTVTHGIGQSSNLRPVLTHRTGRGDIIGEYDFALVADQPLLPAGEVTFTFSSVTSVNTASEVWTGLDRKRNNAQIPDELYVAPNDSLTLTFDGALGPPISAAAGERINSIVIAELVI